MYKRVATDLQWLNAPRVDDVYALSGCVSKNFADYIAFWKHNGYWLFDSPSMIRALAVEHAISLDGAKLFYYEAHDLEYDSNSGSWFPFAPDPAFETNVEAPGAATLEGFDITTFHAGTSPECSPLSCNGLAADVATNEHCLIPTFEAAILALESGRFDNSEPGPCRVIAVYSVNDA
ncbi:MAG: hypothetical protein R3F00_00605 [Dokdonella sp.]